MKTIILALTVFSVFTAAISYRYQTQVKHLDIRSEEDAKAHIFVVLVPETTVRALRAAHRNKARQVEEAGEFVSEILTGALAGDVQPIFGGGLSFISDQDVQQGVSTILENVAPTVNQILKQWVNDASNALGITTTGRPGSVLLSNQTQISNNGVHIGRPITAAQASNLTVEQLIQQQQQQIQAQPIISSNPQPVPPATTIISTTTQTPTDEDDDDDGIKEVN